MEKILVSMGAFGLYQVYLYLLCVIPGFSGGTLVLMWTWTGYETKVRCCVPEFDTAEACASGTANYSNPQLNLDVYAPAVDTALDGYYDTCRVCDYNTTVAEGMNCTSGMDHGCTYGMVYDVADAVIPDTLYFDLGCDNEWKHQLMWSMNTAGMLVGSFIFSTIADYSGRRPVFLWTALATVLVAIALVFATDYYAYIILDTVMGAVNFGAYLSVYVIFMENSDGIWRTILGVWYQAIYTVGMLYIGLMAYLWPTNWQFIQAMGAVPMVVYLFYIWGLPESIRWSIANDRPEQARKNLKWAEKMNRSEIPTDILEEELVTTNFFVHPVKKDEKKVSALQLFSNWNLAKNTLLMWFSWFAASMTYYGLAQNTAELPGDAFTSFVLSGLSEFPGYFVCVPMMEYLGRKPTTIIGFVIGGVACILNGVLEGIASDTLVLVLALIGRSSVAAVFAVIYNYAAEMFPTVVRQSGAGLASLCARIGSLLAPQIHLMESVDPRAPMIIYGAVALAAGALDVFLPETLGKVIPETIDDGKVFGLKKSKVQPTDEDEKTAAATIGNGEKP